MGFPVVFGSEVTHAGNSLSRYDFAAGELVVRVTSGDAGLVRVAERINPKRSFLFVSTVLGRHIPVRPSAHFAAVRELAAGLDHDAFGGEVLVVGFAETAVGLGAAVGRELRRAGARVHVMSTTRHPIPGRVWFSIEEKHSHAATHYVLLPSVDLSRVTSLVVVDDEFSTGATALGLIRALRRVLPGVRSTQVASFASWVPTVVWSEFGVRDVALLRGSFEWIPKSTSGSLPVVTPEEQPVPSGVGWVPHVTPHALLNPPRATQPLVYGTPPDLPSVRSSERVLVIGTGEHVWGPMLFAERLEERGVDTMFIATTRSPIRVGDVIRRKLVFDDHFGLGISMFLHNVDRTAFDRVFIITETPGSQLDSVLLRALRPSVVIDGCGRVTHHV